MESDDQLKQFLWLLAVDKKYMGDDVQKKKAHTILSNNFLYCEKYKVNVCTLIILWLVHSMYIYYLYL